MGLCRSVPDFDEAHRHQVEELWPTAPLSLRRRTLPAILRHIQHRSAAAVRRHRGRLFQRKRRGRGGLDSSYPGTNSFLLS